MRQVYSNEHGVVLRYGREVVIQYVPEPGVVLDVRYGVLTDGVVRDADGMLLVEFAQKVPSRSEPGKERKIILVAYASRPGLLDLAEAAKKEMDAS